MCQAWQAGTIGFHGQPRIRRGLEGRRKVSSPAGTKCYTAVTGFPGAEYRAFDTLRAAQAAFRASYQDFEGRRASTQQWLFAVSKPIIPSLCVDAACDGSPGTLEYRGVDIETGREYSIPGPHPDGTNNVGEFLAIIVAMRLLEADGRKKPIYSDSETAIGWVRAGKCRTGLAHTVRNEALFNLIDDAEKWLSSAPRASRATGCPTGAQVGHIRLG